MKTLLRAGAIALALLACAPSVAQHASDSFAPALKAPEQACVTWSGASIGAGALVPCPASPAGGSSYAVSRTLYQATASGTGFANGDILDRVVTSNPTTGAVAFAYWINLNSGALLSASPAGGSISPLPTALTNTDFGGGCLVVSSDQAYTAGNVQRATCTTTGRWKVGLSSAATTGNPAATISDLQGAVDPSGNQQPNKQDANTNLQVSNRASIFWNGATGTGSLLAASATFTGASRDSGYATAAYHQFAYFSAFFLADQAGTASIECSNDNAAFYTCATAALTASAPLILQVPVLTRYHRAKLVNGASAETYLWVNSGYTGS